MELYLGGCYQGKLSYVQKMHSICEEQVIDGQNLSTRQSELFFIMEKGGKHILNHLQEWIQKCIQNHVDPEELITELITRYPNLIIICDEVGNGIVPMDAFEREYRERTGRIQIALAQKAERVERILCGMGQRLK